MKKRATNSKRLLKSPATATLWAVLSMDRETASEGAFFLGKTGLGRLLLCPIAV
jgi:hypothetical protein